MIVTGDFLSLQSSPPDFYNLVSTLVLICKRIDAFSEMALMEFKSELLLDIIREVSVYLSYSCNSNCFMHKIPALLNGVEDITDILCEKAARLVGGLLLSYTGVQYMLTIEY